MTSSNDSFFVPPLFPDFILVCCLPINSFRFSLFYSESPTKAKRPAYPLECVCVCVIVYLLEKMFLAIQKYYIWFLSRFSSLTSHIIKSSRIYKLYFVDFVKFKSILFLHTRSIYHRFYHSFWTSHFFLFS
jgi:hypothetical protein